MPLAHHPASDILALLLDARQQTAVVVMSTRQHPHLPAFDTPGQPIACSPAMGLADLRRVDAVEPDRAHPSTARGLYPKGIAVDHLRDTAEPGLQVRSGLTGCAATQARQDQHGPHDPAPPQAPIHLHPHATPPC